MANEKEKEDKRTKRDSEQYVRDRIRARKKTEIGLTEPVNKAEVLYKKRRFDR